MCLSLTIAIQPDPAHRPDNDRSSPIWSRVLEENGHKVMFVDVFSSDILKQLQDCDGFMWRHYHTTSHQQVAKRLLPVLERELNMLVYPDQKTCWHFDDKIAQYCLLCSHRVPMPKTWVFYDRSEAEAWAQGAAYPVVLKLYSGASSTNVTAIRTVEDALHWIRVLFEHGCYGLDAAEDLLVKSRKRRLALAYELIRHGRLPLVPFSSEYSFPHHRYAYFQEFIPNNSFDTRIMIIGGRAFGFRRFNRPNDFRASGSGRFVVTPEDIDLRFVEFAFDVTRRLGASSLAFDFLLKDNSPVLVEMSYTTVSWTIHNCPGHWDEKMNWVEGQMWPEEAQAQDFMLALQQRFN